MNSSIGSIIVVSNSDKFHIYLDGLMINNIYFKNLDDFNRAYQNFPLTSHKILVFESGIINLDSIKHFSDIIKDELSQVGEILFLVSADFKEYFKVALDSYDNKKFISEDITYKKLEAIITESKSYELKTEVETVDVVQRKRKAPKKEDKVDRFLTRVTIDRKADNTKMSRESELLDKNVEIVETPKKENTAINSNFNYIRYKNNEGTKSNNVLLYDSGLNIYKIIKSEYAHGRRLMFIDISDSMFFSFLIENDKTIPTSLLLEDVYSEGANEDKVKNYIADNDVCIIRNSYNIKKSLTSNEIKNLVKFIIGRYGNVFDNVFIITDDLKVDWVGSTRYVILPPTIDYLMKFVNFIEKESISSIYVKLDKGYDKSDFRINSKTVKGYIENLKIDTVKVIDGDLDETMFSSTYLFELNRLEAGETEESLDKRRRLKSK